MRISDWSSDVCSSDLAPRGVDLHIPDAWAAAQRRIDGRLQARLSDQGSHYKRRGGFLEISISRLADIAHHVGRNAPLRLEARRRANDDDARRAGRVHFDPRYRVQAQNLSHAYGKDHRGASRSPHT